MPHYEFVCERCGEFALQRSVASAAALARCPTCQAGARRIFSVPGLIRTPASLRRRVEGGVEPTVVTRPRPEPEQSAASRDRRYGSRGRPWQVAHGISSTPVTEPKLRRL